MAELRFPTVFILAPPFLSHFRPLMGLAAALKAGGAQVTVGCTTAFRNDIEEAGLRFSEVVINRNANRGIATETSQDDREAARLAEFLDATRKGAVETLVTQASHRTADMFANPEELIGRIRDIEASESPSLWIVDQLSYGATLALHGLGAPTITFCAPHPLSIPAAGEVYGVPPSWPAALQPPAGELARLVAAATEVEKTFTARFNALLRSHFNQPGVPSAFGLTSPRGVVYNYPPFFEREENRPWRIYGGHMGTEQPLPDEWRAILVPDRPRILLALGTFLSARDDVLTGLVAILRSLRPDAQLIVGAGAAADRFDSSPDRDVVARRFIPQRALLDQVDIAIHHGGVSSFTESLHAGKPMMVMPFSSDQFNVARDVERYRLGAVLNPNALTRHGVESALATLAGESVLASVAQWSAIIRKRGPAYVAARIQERGHHESD